MEKEPRIIKVDFGARRAIESEPPPSGSADIASIQSQQAQQAEDLTFYNEAVCEVGEYRIFLGSIRGLRQGQTYSDAMVRLQHLPIRELVKMLKTGNRLWQKNPQHYWAIADLIVGKIPREAEEKVLGKSGVIEQTNPAKPFDEGNPLD